MEVSRLLNPSEDEGAVVPSFRRTEQFRRLASSSSASSTSSSSSHHHHQHHHLLRLNSLETALPSLARTFSDDSGSGSDSVRSPLTPEFTPELRYERDSKRRPQRPRLAADSSRTTLPPLHRHSSSRSLTPPMDYDHLNAQAFADSIGASDFGSYQQILPSPASAAAALQQQQQLHQPQQIGSTRALLASPPTARPTPLEHQYSHTSRLSSSASSSQRPSQKKNSYPCPVSKQYNCSEHFTTSGHAARHAKKHTGKKDAICPECNKAFTRKDNMEQHRRTHQPGRANAKSTSNDDKRKSLKLQNQQNQRHPRNLSISETSPKLPDTANQSMPAGIISPQPLPASTDLLGGVALDPQLRSPTSQRFEPGMSSSSIPYWRNPNMQFTPNSSFSTASTANMTTETRPRLQRSDHADYMHRPLSLDMTARSSSSSSVGSSPDVVSVSSKHNLDDLALAASQVSSIPGF